MAKQLIDYSAGVPRASEVKKAGFGGAVRYVSPARAAWMLGKPIHKREADDYRANGLEIVSVYQNLKEDWKRGRTGGVVDATDAIIHHLAASGPRGAYIYCAIDSNPSPEEFRSHALPYIEGFWETLRLSGYRPAVYCNTKVMGWLEGRGFKDFLWWKHGWGSDARIEGAAIHQYEIDKYSVDGVKVDRNHVYVDDYGQWSKVGAQESAPAPAPAPKKLVVNPMKAGTYTVSSGYGNRSGGFHAGIDYAAPIGTPIYAVADGYVVEGRDRTGVSGFGSWIWIDCQDSVGRDFIYGHVQHSGILVTGGDRIKAGQQIGVVGNEGESTGPHLHFEVWGPPGREGGKNENPATWLVDNVTELDLGPNPTPAPAPAPAPAPTPPKEEKPVSTPGYVLPPHQFQCDVNIWCPNGGTRDPFATQYSVFHTTENGDTAKATDIAKWQSNPANGSSYNLLFGVDGQTVRTNDDNRIPWAAGQPGSAKGTHASFVGQAARTREHWFRFPAQLEAAARWAADEHLRYGRPLVWLSPADVKAKKRGFCSHGTVFNGDGGPAYRSDPGAGFPHDWVLQRAYELVSGPIDPKVFPLPKGWYFGPLEGPTESVSGVFGTELPQWIDGLKRWQKAVGIPETGKWDSATQRVATELQKEKGWPNNPNWAEINGGFGGIYEGEWNAVIQEGWTPGPKELPEKTPKPDPAPRDPDLVTPPTKEPEVTTPPEPTPPTPVKAVGKIRDISGPGISDRYGINATDLGISVRMKNGEILTIFGDSFRGNKVGDGEWRSPVGLISKTENLDAGLTWDRAAGPDPRDAKQLLPYAHNNGTFSTVLPSDLVVLPDGTIVMHVMVNQGLGNVVWSELQVSRDNAVSWQHSGIKFGGDWNSGFRQLWTMEYNPDDGFVYALSTGFQRNKGLILHRIHWEEILKPGSEGRWEPWGYANGKWAWGNAATVVLPGKFGELYLRRLDKGYWTLTYFNAEHYRIDAMVFDSPIANLHVARDQQKTLVRGGAWGAENDNSVAQLYCGCPIPGSTPSRWHYVVSQWNTSTGWPYKSMQFVNSIPAPAGYKPVVPQQPVINNPVEPETPAPEDPKGQDPVPEPTPTTPTPAPAPAPSPVVNLIKSFLGLFGFGK